MDIIVELDEQEINDLEELEYMVSGHLNFPEGEQVLQKILKQCKDK